eukprot:m.87808 g.87808  ORF g.87808 m.87808 type:complete len:218 (-) comp9724_c0_seq4:893-1546(-)
MLQLVRQTAALALRAPLSNTGRPLMQRAFSASSAPPSRAGHALVRASEQRGCVALGGVTNRAMTQAVQLPPMPCVVGRSLCTARALGSAAQNTASASTTLSPVLKEKRFAVVQINGKQYKVTESDFVITAKLPAAVGSRITLNKVLLVGSESWTAIGTPLVGDAKVTAIVHDHHRGAKLQVFKKKRRKGYTRRKGHRTDYTTLRIASIAYTAPSPPQ